MNKQDRLSIVRRLKQHKGTRQERVLFAMGYAACIADVKKIFRQSDDLILEDIEMLFEREEAIRRSLKRL